MSVSALMLTRAASLFARKQTKLLTPQRMMPMSLNSPERQKMTFELHFAFLLRSKVIVIVKFSKIRILQNQHYWAAVATETLVSPADSDWMEVTQVGASRGRMC